MKERQRWQPEEDALLHAYVKQYGPREWHLISQRMGRTLDRDPKSCLERWKNYLKPGIKKGSLTAEEQNLVISLQAKYGNKWKKIAAEVPGRTAKRLGKWWEVFKEKQLKQLNKSHSDYGASPEKPAQGKYDHILDTFAEKYVQPKLISFQPPVLSLGSASAAEPVNSAAALPPWMNAIATPTTTSSLTSSSSTPSPSVSLTLSPSEPAVLDPEAARFMPVQNMGSLIQHVKDLEEGRELWLRHKKEAAWRLSRLEQQLESEKARRRRETMEEIEAKIRSLREEETAYVSRVEGEYIEQLMLVQREAEAEEAKLMEAWCSVHVRLGKLLESHHGRARGSLHVHGRSPFT
uniref:MYB transcription factor MYB1 n=1 Tax=Mentha canadensis TaxID=294733 RepID=A0AAU7PJE0_9LAMI